MHESISAMPIHTQHGILHENNQEANTKMNVKATKNITRMVIFVSFLNIMTIVPYAGLWLISQLVTLPADYVNCANLLFLLAPGCEIFGYYSFNKLYRRTLKDYLKKIFGKLGICFI